jgi:hypothetical protein
MNLTYTIYELIEGRINEFSTNELVHMLVLIMLHSAEADVLQIIKTKICATVVNSGDLI